MKSLRVLVCVLICFAALLALGGCGTGTASPANPTPTPATAPTVTLAASPTVILPNASTTLTWSSTSASSVSIDNGVGSVAAGSGQTTVKPAQTTTYTITATGAGGTATAKVTVTVSALAPTVTIAANPTTVVTGTASVLTVVATNAASVVISNNVDSKTVTLPVTGGTSSVTPTQTTIYTATATGTAGSVTATATVTVTPPPPTVTIAANPVEVVSGGTSTLTVTATNATSVVISDNLDTTTFPLAPTGGTQSVTLTKTTIYTVTATGLGGTTTATVTVRITGSVGAVNHVLFLMQENRTFDTYFGMLNPYRVKNGWNVGDDKNTYNVDGIDDKLSTTNPMDDGTPIQLFKTTSTCLDDMTSAWEESYGDVNRYNFTTSRPILMDGFVHIAQGFASSGSGSGTFTDPAGKRAMAYYDEGYLNYYYYMASQFALSDRWFSPVSSKSTPNRLATLTGGTTQGLVRDPFVNDKLPTLATQSIFEELDKATPAVSWKIYYSLTDAKTSLPVTTFSDFNYSGKYVIPKTASACVLPFVANASNSFCIDASHIAPVSQLFTDMTNGTLPSFSYIEAGYGANDEHPGSGQSILLGQTESAGIINALMASKSWADSVFFLSYDEGGGPYDHVPPVPGHSNDKTTTANMGFLPATGIPDISTIAVNPDSFAPCLADGPVDPTTGIPTASAHCDLVAKEPGTNPADAASKSGFAAQLGFRLPNMVISPFTRKHYVSHVPMDHTAVIKFVESRFIGPTAHLTQRDAAQPDLLDFFDFTAVPWATAPLPANIPVPPAVGATCHAASM